MKNLTKLTIAIMLGASSTVASAGTVIKDWTYINEAGFINATTGNSVVDPTTGENTTLDPNTLLPLDPTGRATPYTNNVFNPEDGLNYNLGRAGYTAGTSDSGATAGASGESVGTSILSTGSLIDEICWGSGPSCLAFENEAGDDTSRVEGSLTVDSNGGVNWNQGTQMVHKNLPTGAPSLTSIDIIDGLKLYSSEIIGGELPLIELGIDVIFNETFADARTLWPYTPDDAFIVTLDPVLSPITSFGPDFIEFTVQLDLTGLTVDANAHTQYEVITRISGLDVVSIPGGNTFGLITPENGINFLDAQFALRAVGVPEPGSLAVFGLGLLGLAGVRRYKK
ncbi:PEP-CTERM sorting domain-containing protein [Catenovulum sp. 2E275]|nr:PEP-CTERM sorting domain-containing protein [Catenovulum sp. 2E275]